MERSSFFKQSFTLTSISSFTMLLLHSILLSNCVDLETRRQVSSADSTSSTGNDSLNQTLSIDENRPEEQSQISNIINDSICGEFLTNILDFTQVKRTYNSDRTKSITSTYLRNSIFQKPHLGCYLLYDAENGVHSRAIVSLPKNLKTWDLYNDYETTQVFETKNLNFKINGVKSSIYIQNIYSVNTTWLLKDSTPDFRLYESALLYLSVKLKENSVTKIQLASKSFVDSLWDKSAVLENLVSSKF